MPENRYYFGPWVVVAVVVSAKKWVWTTYMYINGEIEDNLLLRGSFVCKHIRPLTHYCQCFSLCQIVFFIAIYGIYSLQSFGKYFNNFGNGVHLPGESVLITKVQWIEVVMRWMTAFEPFGYWLQLGKSIIRKIHRECDSFSVFMEFLFRPSR